MDIKICPLALAGIWITGALMPSVGAIQPLEQDLGVPVLTSMQAMAWAGLKLTGVKAQITGYGRLVRIFRYVGD